MPRSAPGYGQLRPISVYCSILRHLEPPVQANRVLRRCGKGSLMIGERTALPARAARAGRRPRPSSEVASTWALGLGGFDVGDAALAIKAVIAHSVSPCSVLSMGVAALILLSDIRIGNTHPKTPYVIEIDFLLRGTIMLTRLILIITC